MSRRLEVAPAARGDIAQILQASATDFGEGARSRYASLVAAAIKDLLEDPERPESLDRSELRDGIRSYHLRHSRRRAATGGTAVKSPRHLILYIAPTADLLVVLRVLHDAMEIERHLPGE